MLLGMKFVWPEAINLCAVILIYTQLRVVIFTLLITVSLLLSTFLLSEGTAMATSYCFRALVYTSGTCYGAVKAPLMGITVSSRGCRMA